MGLRIKRRQQSGEPVRQLRRAPEAKVVQLVAKVVPDPLIERLKELASRHQTTAPAELAKALPQARLVTDEQGVVTARKVRISSADDEGVRIVSSPLDDLTSYRLRN